MTFRTESKTAGNGVDVGALLAAREAIQAAPEAGQFTWRAHCAWIDGVQSRTTMEGFFGLGEEQARKAPHIVDADHPEQFAATDMGPTPAELVLSALAGCLIAGVTAVAENRGIPLKSVQAKVDGDMDLAGVLGIDGEVRNGFKAIRIAFEIDAEATPAEIAALVAQSQKRSAVFDLVTNPTNVHVTVA